MFHKLFLSAVATAFLGATAALAGEYDDSLRQLTESDLAAWAAEPSIVDAVRAQNAANAGISQADIDNLDQTWRAEVGAAASPMIDEVLARPGSVWLQSKKDDAGGLVTEVFVTDNHGLNVAQSDVTSDYWQGDEAKWQETFGKPAGTIHFGDVELDESTQTYQSQVSIPVFDPDTNESIGAITFGIDLSLL